MRLFTYQTRTLPSVRLLGKIRYKTPWQHFSRQIDEFILYAIKDGTMHLEENNRKHVLKPGDVFLLEPNLLHKGYQSAPCEYFYAHFKHPDLTLSTGDPESDLRSLLEKRMASLMSNNLLDQTVTDGIAYLPKHLNLPGGVFNRDLQVLADLYEQRQEFYKEATSTGFHGFLLWLSHELLMTSMNDWGFGRIRRSEVVAEQILNYLNNNYMKKIASSDIEAMFEMNFDHINRVYKKMTGFTIFEHLRTIRMNNAMHLIKTSNLSFSEVGYLVGIEDRYYFSRLFHKHTRMTPTEYYNITHEKKG